MRTSRFLGLGAAALLAVSLSACATADAGADSADTAGGSGDSAFPVTIEHAFGSTTIEEKPENVATIAWANHEVPLALGIVPVGMSKATWGDDDDNGVLPWVEEKLDELGAETPVLFDETDGIDFEAVADTAPDVILASYSGLTQEEYDTLSKIAPVVAYPDIAWGTPWEEMVEMNSAALGLADEGDALIEELHGTIDEALANNAALEGKKVLFSFLDVNDLSQVGYYTTVDTRPGFLASVGLPMASILEESAHSTDFYLSVSSEEADKFSDVDVFVTYGDESIIPVLQADPLLSKIPAIAAGNIAILPDASPIAASANPSPLSIQWGIDEYFGILAAPLAD